MTDNGAESATTTSDSSARERFIRDMYATIEFFTAHPELPAPWGVTISCAMGTNEKVIAVAEKMGTHEYGSAQDDGVGQADFDIPGTVSPVNVIVSARQDPRRDFQ